MHCSASLLDTQTATSGLGGEVPATRVQMQAELCFLPGYPSIETA
jgi:hypothetical protein